MRLSRNEFDSRADRPVLLLWVKPTLGVGNLGLSGWLYCKFLKRKLQGQVAIQGVDYNCFTSIFSLFWRGSNTGAQRMMEMVEAAVKRRPNQKVFLCGYSQGALVIRKALAQLQPETCDQISGIILMGDPATLVSPCQKNLNAATRFTISGYSTTVCTGAFLSLPRRTFGIPWSLIPRLPTS
ncbi:Alpha/Beta hydrolase protein [Lasiosphaeris hirsuta]|uniref:cutinase n=1 Tax=Lasiosphaeris hirsuta TaxID=260670 RepID=A0AA40AGI3_9PEZI|nr:Alpha/Beta hydrolase protein [Lasiosphaeris hirsuta]